MASGSSLPAGGMWRAAPVKATKISRGELSQYRSRAALNGGGRPLAIACAIRLACSSVGENFGWARLIALSPNHAMVAGSRILVFAKVGEIHKARAVPAGQPGVHAIPSVVRGTVGRVAGHDARPRDRGGNETFTAGSRVYLRSRGDQAGSGRTATAPDGRTTTATASTPRSLVLR